MPQDNDGLFIVDAQIHVPNLPHTVLVDGIEEDEVLREMDEAGVNGLMIVPLAAPGPDASIYNAPAIEIAERRPERFRVMGRFDLTRPENAKLLPNWKSSPMMLGARVSLIRDPNMALLVNNELEWFWTACEEANVAVAVLVMNEHVAMLGEIATRHPGLKLTVDHFGLSPHVMYDDPMPGVQAVLALAHLPNVSVKASALAASVNDTFPFRSLHEPIHRVVDAFGPQRVFWGSDLTRLPCSYGEWVRVFTEELPFLSRQDKEWIMSRSLMEWVGWIPS